ncbi:hypothetical protein LWM68_33580 [Niabella sp. W65]|nr:hypothetical protein [Niabella sp. W65]MCH7367257.1 hypothetical protein [Niabella sp. W65]
MSYYDQAQLDSIKFLELVKNDPNYKNIGLADTDEYLSGKKTHFNYLPMKEG